MAPARPVEPTLENDRGGDRVGIDAVATAGSAASPAGALPGPKLFRFPRGHALVDEMDLNPEPLSKGGREALDAADLGPGLFPLETERDSDHHRFRLNLESRGGDRCGRVPDRGNVQALQRRGQHPGGVTEREPKPTKAEIHA